jgi:hypothetical protein
MSHVFTVWSDGQLITVDQYDLIPDIFDFVIEFQPEIPPEPHNEQQHQEIDQWQDKFFELLKRAKSCQQ